MATIFGGGASADAERSRRMQEIANTRQLSQQQSAQARETLTRRAPRGRRLFADAGGNQLKSDLS
jgi:hypothetical protein